MKGSGAWFLIYKYTHGIFLKKTSKKWGMFTVITLRLGVSGDRWVSLVRGIKARYACCGSIRQYFSSSPPPLSPPPPSPLPPSPCPPLPSFLLVTWGCMLWIGEHRISICVIFPSFWERTQTKRNVKNLQEVIWIVLAKGRHWQAVFT